jgi:hypothetical protein
MGGRDLPSARVSLKEGGVELARCSIDRAVMGAGAGSTYRVSLAELVGAGGQGWGGNDGSPLRHSLQSQARGNPRLFYLQCCHRVISKGALLSQFRSWREVLFSTRLMCEARRGVYREGIMMWVSLSCRRGFLRILWKLCGETEGLRGKSR